VAQEGCRLRRVVLWLCKDLWSEDFSNIWWRDYTSYCSWRRVASYAVQRHNVGVQSGWPPPTVVWLGERSGWLGQGFRLHNQGHIAKGCGGHRVLAAVWYCRETLRLDWLVAWNGKFFLLYITGLSSFPSKIILQINLVFLILLRILGCVSNYTYIVF